MSDTALSGFPELDADYELLTELGRGGMAVVYLARDRQLGREVAIKVIHTGIVDAAGIERQLQEARTVAQLQHPNVVAIFAVKQLGTGGGLGVALVMQYIPGRSLDRAMREDGRFTPERAEAILADITAALAYAHARGVVHRDIKPENIFLNEETGLALLSDFGIALSAENRRHQPNPDLLVGTPAYMSPEQIDDLALDGRSDLFSLGLVGYEMLAGIRPWIDEPPSDVLFRQRFEPLLALQDVRSDVSHRLCAVIERAIAKDRTDRWPSAVAMLSALTDDEWVPDEPAPSDQKRAGPTTIADAPVSPAPTVANPTPVHTVVYRRGLAPGGDIPRAETPPRPPEPRTGPMREPTPAEDLPPLWSRPNADRRRPWLIAIPVVLIGALVVGLAVAGPSGVHLFPSTGQADSTTQDSIGRATRNAFAERAEDSAAAAATQAAAERATADSASRAHQLGVMRDSIRRLDSMARAASRRPPVQQESAATPGRPPARLLGGIATNATPPSAGGGGTGASGAGSPFGGLRPSSPATTPAPAPPPPAPSPITPPASPTVAAGGTHTCAISGNGNVSCWGGNDRGQLGTGGDANAPSPTVLGAGPFAMISAGLGHTCGVLRSGAIDCWGANDYGQLGDSTFNPHTLPQRVTVGSRTFRSVSVGMAHTCALATNGDVYCWGRNNSGQLGDGSVNTERSPVRVAATAAFVALSVGWYHACALTAVGQAFCWGQNSNGELGDGSTVVRTIPVPVSSGADPVTFRAIAAGGSHTCALATDGQAYCWGRDTYGQLGNGDVVNRATPTKVASAQPFVSITAGGVHTCALTALGQAYCWGRNSYGQLGDGGTIDHPVPVAVRGAPQFRSINASGSHTCGRTTNGGVLCWGYNSDGQLGDGSTLHHPEPISVTGLQ